MMRVSVVIATLGRPKEVGQLIELLQQQTLLPSEIVVSATSPSDLPADLRAGIQVILGPAGSSAQRNRGMELILSRCDIVVFFDDDYVPSKYALASVANLFIHNPGVVGVTGLVLADGVVSGGIDFEIALAKVTSFDEKTSEDILIERDVQYTYGCNMGFRVCAIHETRFDEDLPLYGWQEDVDFAARLLSKGRIVKSNAFVGVHRGITSGRTSGVRLGFSQIVNPIYLLRKGTMDRGKASGLIARNLIANHIRMFWPEHWVDRRGRVKGNWLGILSVLTGPADPRKVLDIVK